MIRKLNLEDYKAWIELAKEVEPLFGPMTEIEEFREGMIYCINNENAFCVETESKEIGGIIAINRKEREILWFAVKEKERRKAYGEKLLSKAIEELGDKKHIYVQTFAPNIDEGKSAINLYKKKGFEAYKDAEINPAGLETVIMRRKKQ
ncbi:MAG: GNAT family N-acetyltransferase [Hyphomicrobiales bacterium]